MKDRRKHQILTCFIASVWLINGLFCKLLNWVPRHQQIVGRILGEDPAPFLTALIGVSEIAMAVWVLSGFRSRVNAITQIVVIAVMNILEVMLVPELLLWGRANALFAFLLILVICYNEFQLNHRLSISSRYA